MNNNNNRHKSTSSLININQFNNNNNNNNEQFNSGTTTTTKLSSARQKQNLIQQQRSPYYYRHYSTSNIKEPVQQQQQQVHHSMVQRHSSQFNDNQKKKFFSSFPTSSTSIQSQSKQQDFVQRLKGNCYKFTKLSSGILNNNNINSNRLAPSTLSMSLVQQQQQQSRINNVAMNPLNSHLLIGGGGNKQQSSSLQLIGKSQFDHNNNNNNNNNSESIRSMSSNESSNDYTTVSGSNPEISRSVFCPLCDNSKSFCATSSVTRHLRSVHKLNDLFRTKHCYCLVCGHFVEDIETYYAHLKDQHQIVLQPMPAAQINPSLSLSASELVTYNKHFFDNFDEFIRWKTTQLELETGCQYEQCFTYDYPRSIYYKCAAMTLHSNHVNNNGSNKKNCKSGGGGGGDMINSEHDYIRNNHPTNNTNNNNGEVALNDSKSLSNNSFQTNNNNNNNTVSVIIDNKFDARMYPCTSSIRLIYHRSGIEARLLPTHLVHALHSSPTKIVLGTSEQILIPSRKSSNSHNHQNSEHQHNHPPPPSHNNNHNNHNNNSSSSNTNSFKHQKITNSKLLNKSSTTNYNGGPDDNNSNSFSSSNVSSALNGVQLSQQPQPSQFHQQLSSSESKYSISNVELPSDEEESHSLQPHRIGLHHHHRTPNLSQTYIQNNNDPSLNTTVSVVVPQSPSSFLNSPLSDPPSTQPTIFDESMLIINDNVNGVGADAEDDGHNGVCLIDDNEEHRFNDQTQDHHEESVPLQFQQQQQQLHQTTPTTSESTLSAYSDTNLPLEPQDSSSFNTALLHDSAVLDSTSGDVKPQPIGTTTKTAFETSNQQQVQIVSLEKGLETVQESIRPRKHELREKFEQLLDACITESDIDLVEISLSSVSGHLLPNHFD